MDPFPHIHIPQVLPWSLYKELEETYPEELMLKGETKGFGDMRYQQKDFDYSIITPLWKAFADYNTSKFFKDEAVQALQEGIKYHYGDKLYTKYARADVKPRYETGPADAMKMEMQFVINAIIVSLLEHHTLTRHENYLHFYFISKSMMIKLKMVA